MEQKIEQQLMQPAPKAPLFISWVTSSQLHSLLNPSHIADYEERTKIMEQIPLIQELINKGLPQKTLISMLKCGHPSPTDKALMCTCGCGSRIGRIHHHCSNRACPKCAKRRERKLFRKYYPLVRNLSSTSSHSLKFVTISPKNYDTLAQGQEHIRKAISKMLRTKYFKERIVSGLYVIESKSKNRDGEAKGWNVHAHMIIYSRFINNRLYGQCKSCNKKRWLKYDKHKKRFYCSSRACNSLDVEWDGNDSPAVMELKKVLGRAVTLDVRAIKDRFNPYGRLKNQEHALNYCLKYVGADKGQFNSLSDFAQYIVYTSNRRLVNVFGRFYDFKNDKLQYVCFKCEQPVKFQRVDPALYFAAVPPPST